MTECCYSGSGTIKVKSCLTNNWRINIIILDICMNKRSLLNYLRSKMVFTIILCFRFEYIRNILTKCVYITIYFRDVSHVKANI